MLILNFSPFPVLITERLLLRAATLQDAEKLSIIRSDARVNLHLERNATMSIKEAEERIHKLAACTQQNESIEWIIQFKDNVEMLGSICLWNIIPALKQVEIGYEIALDYRNRGLATEMTKGLIENAFRDERVRLIVAHTLGQDNASTKVLQKCGFKKVEEINDPDDGLIWKWELKR